MVPKNIPTSTHAREDYLEQIHNLIEEKGYARVADVAENLGIAQASVTNMIQRLDADGLVHYEKYRGVVLSETGSEIAVAIADRHATLTRFLEMFGLDDETIYRDVEGMEHHISATTLEAIRALNEELEGAPKLRLRIKQKLRSLL